MMIDDEPKREPLSIWTLYDSPSDCPGKFVVRRWVMEGKEWRATEQAYKADSPDPLERLMDEMGLCWMPRLEEDEQQIVGCWI
jgi:hypothetical protein